MKKSLLVLMSLVLMLSLALSVSAKGENAFENVMITADTKIYDAPGTDNPIAYMEAYGVGYSSKGDQVWFEDLDFGANGADKITINFSYGTEGNSTNIAFFVDSTDGEPAAKLNIGYTGGWESTYAKEFTTDIEVPAGKHTIIVEFLDETGSFNYIRCNEAPAKAAEEPAASTNTADPMILTVVLAASSLAGAVVMGKRSK